VTHSTATNIRLLFSNKRIKYISWYNKVEKHPYLETNIGTAAPLEISFSESSGGWHPSSFDYLKSIGEHISSRMNKTSKEAVNSILSLTSSCLQRHQGAMLARQCLALT
jgi:hypothetical protein